MQAGAGQGEPAYSTRAGSHRRARRPQGAPRRARPVRARLAVHAGGLGNPISLPAGGAAHEAARDAHREAWEGVEPVNSGFGGSIPLIAEFQRLFPDASGWSPA